jgi:toxin ParE1/3/4
LRFYDAAEASIQRLVENPNLGSVCEFESPELAGVRVWPVRGFRKHLIFFRPTEAGVEILRVLHGSRDFERLVLR